jgi:ATP-dependent RNA helicase RhlE
LAKGSSIKAFEKLNLHPQLLRAIEEANYTNTTAIQKKIIPMAMRGRDILGASKSGTGKTLAYLLPLLHRLQKVTKKESKVIRALIIVPTIELADQVSRNLIALSRYLDIRTIKIQGGSNKHQQLQKIKAGADIVVATTGRLHAFINEGKINLEHVNTIILDETDTMLELGFIEDIEAILKSIKKERQILCFSATISQNIKRLAKSFMNDPLTIEVHQRRDRVDLITHQAYRVNKKDRLALLLTLIERYCHEEILIFVNTKERANALFEHLKKEGIWTSLLHGGLSRSARAKSLNLLKSGKTQVLIATDIASRGIDIHALPLVINFDLPPSTDDFTHRVGRTGRANVRGRVITLLTVNDYQPFSTIEKHLKLQIKREVMEGFEITDKAPRQARPRKKSIKEKKSKIPYAKQKKQTASKDNPKRGRR